MKTNHKVIKILGIETSCDDTGVAIISTKYDPDDKNRIISKTIHERLSSQISVHSQYGGVVPELASRDHVKKTIPLIKEALKEAEAVENKKVSPPRNLGPWNNWTQVKKTKGPDGKDVIVVDDSVKDKFGAGTLAEELAQSAGQFKGLGSNI